MGCVHDICILVMRVFDSNWISYRLIKAKNIHCEKWIGRKFIQYHIQCILLWFGQQFFSYYLNVHGDKNLQSILLGYVSVCVCEYFVVSVAHNLYNRKYLIGPRIFTSMNLCCWSNDIILATLKLNQNSKFTKRDWNQSKKKINVHTTFFSTSILINSYQIDAKKKPESKFKKIK